MLHRAARVQPAVRVASRIRYRPQIRFGLGAVRGLGEAALETVFQAATPAETIGDLFDFAVRVAPNV